MPKIVGYNEEEATKMLEELGLKMEVTGRVVSEEYVIAGFVRNPWITLGSSMVLMVLVLGVIAYRQKK